MVAGHHKSSSGPVLAAMCDCKYALLSETECEPLTSVRLYFQASWLPLCVYPCLSLLCGYCVSHKGVLSPPSWPYQSLAEFYGAAKVIHTVGSSRKKLATVPYLFSPTQTPTISVFVLVLFFLSVSFVKRINRGHR